jgi:hypothetical protein
MRHETRQNTLTLCVNTTPYEILGPDPSRKSILLSPVAGGTFSAPGYISLSHRQDVVPGAGAINFIVGATFILTLTDREIGDAIGLPWWIVSTYPVKVQIVEYSYVNLSDCGGR